MPSLDRYIKDPDANLDYPINWEPFLNGDTISSVLWTVPAGLTRGSESNTSTIATIFLSGGTSGQKFTIGCRITTAGGRTDERSIDITIQDK